MNFTLSDWLTIHIRVLLVIECNDYDYSIDVTSLPVVTTASEFIGTLRTQVEEYQPWLLPCVRLASFLFSQEEEKKRFWRSHCVAMTDVCPVCQSHRTSGEDAIRLGGKVCSLSSSRELCLLLLVGFSMTWGFMVMDVEATLVVWRYQFFGFFSTFITSSAWRTHTHWPRHGNEICGLANDSKLSFQNHRVLDDSHLNCL